MMIFGEVCVLSLIYSYVAVCTFCAVCCVIIIASFCYFLITRLLLFNILFMLFACIVFLFSVLCISRFCVVLCIVLYIVSPLAYNCFAPNFVQVYRSRPPGQ